MASEGIRIFGNRILTPAEGTPQFLRELLDRSAVAGPPEASRRSELNKEILAAPDTAFREVLMRQFSKMSRAEATEIREWLEKIRHFGANPLEFRNQQIAALQKSIKGTPGPKAAVPKEAWDWIEDCSQKLRPVVRLVLEVMETQRLLLRDAVKSVQSLHPDWKSECGFMLSNSHLVDRAMNLSKFKRAKIRGRSSLLSDAIACQFAGFEVSPAYSMQILEQIRRFQK